MDRVVEKTPFKTTFEPFRIKSVEPIEQRSREERRKILKEAHYNPFLVQSKDVLIDLLTDSGTGAMSCAQWSAIMVADESYACSTSFQKFEKAVQDIFGYNTILPTHQGRAAERILFHEMLSPGQIVPNNSHFDTTLANIQATGAVAVNLPCKQSYDYCKDTFIFKGNMDVIRLRELLESHDKEQIPLVMMTITNNARGGFPVSMANIKEVSNICRSRGIPFFFDACRFAENAWFIKMNEIGYKHKTAKEISQEMFRYADGCTMSAKKNGLCNIGGFLAMNDEVLAKRCVKELILSEGFITYGGLSGRDLEAIAIGLYEVLQDSYLQYQMNFIHKLSDVLKENSIAILEPVAAHAVYIDVGALLPKNHQLPAWSLACALYIEGGIRATEIGSVMMGKTGDDQNNNEVPELLRLAIPRRVYTESHLRYVAEVVVHVANNSCKIPGYKFIYAPDTLRHFTAHFEPVSRSDRNEEDKEVNDIVE